MRYTCTWSFHTWNHSIPFISHINKHSKGGLLTNKTVLIQQNVHPLKLQEIILKFCFAQSEQRHLHEGLNVTHSDTQVWVYPTCPSYCTVLSFGPWVWSQADSYSAALSPPLQALGAKKPLCHFPEMSTLEGTAALETEGRTEFILYLEISSEHKLGM